VSGLRGCREVGYQLVDEDKVWRSVEWVGGGYGNHVQRATQDTKLTLRGGWCDTQRGRMMSLSGSVNWVEDEAFTRTTHSHVTHTHTHSLSLSPLQTAVYHNSPVVLLWYTPCCCGANSTAMGALVDPDLVTPFTLPAKEDMVDRSVRK
jgi:hypothetical protein